MGRRKLPSIPSYSSYSTTPLAYSAPPIPFSGTIGMPAQSLLPLAVQTQTDPLRQRTLRAQTSPAPVYINASAPIPSTSSCYSPFTVSSTCTQTITTLPSFEKLPNGQLSADYSRPSSATSVTTSSPLTRLYDPAIIPGASFRLTAKHRTALRQPVSTITSRASNAPKIPNTLARVLLKKELKEALSRRREALEACEIEANQRQYIVHKMLVTGLLPEAREDDIPKVTPCMLPIELITGARVMPKSVHTVATQMSDQDFRFPTKTSGHVQCKPHLTSPVIVQENIPPAPVSRVKFKPSTSLRAQLNVERKPQYRDITSARNVETQTEQIFSDYSASSRQKPSTSHGLSTQSSRSNATVQTNDLLEATKKYFEDYDRQLNELTEKAKRSAQRRQFDFHDDDPLSKEQRRKQLINELAQRRERMLAQVGLPSETMPCRSYHSQLALDSSNYPVSIPQYGSLPRIDYPCCSRRSPLTRDYTVRERLPFTTNSFYNYGSLPRNYERCLGQQVPIQVDYEQSFGGRPVTARATSRSMFDLHSDNIIDHRYRPPPTHVRSLNYLDQIGVDRMDCPTYFTQLRADPYLTSGVYPNDANVFAQPFSAQQDDMVSRYATYLNQQFQTGLLNHSDVSRSSYMPSTAPAVRYDPQATDPYFTTPPSTYLPPFAYCEPVGVRNLPYEAPQVYSRNETNYGARPPNYPLDYGNRLLRTTEFQPFEDPYSTSLYNTSGVLNGQAVPQSSQTIPNYTPLRSSYPSMISSGLPYVTKNTSRTWSGNLMPSSYDTQYPHEDALTRMYATIGRRRPANSGMPTYVQDGGAPSPSFFMNDRCRRGGRDVLPVCSVVRHDLGIRVVGGKRMPNGDLGAFVSAVNQARNNQILGEVKEGDQVLEWNGVLLNGKTFEEVERIVNSSSGEVEIILKSEREESHLISNLRKYYQNRDKKRSTNLCTPSQSLQKSFRINDVSPDRTPPVPMHRRNGYENSYGRQNPAARIYDNVDGLNFADDAAMKKQQDSLGYLQIAVSYDRHTSRLIVRIIAARGLRMRDPIRHLAPNPFVKIYLLPVRKVSNKRRTRFVPCSTNPEWNQIVEWQVSPIALSSLFLEFSVWDYDRVTENNALGQVTISLSDRNLISGQAFWLALQPLTNPRSITQHLNVPLDNERPQVYQYNSGISATSLPLAAAHFLDGASNTTTAFR
uniref:PDZ domain-containing protein n=1 Tax=Angiostrongylus cantonensis TaxID=6313 RepID=A0A0K0DC62_ANGCA